MYAGFVFYFYLAFILLYGILDWLLPKFFPNIVIHGVILQGSIRGNMVVFGLPIGQALLAPNDLGLLFMTIAFMIPLLNAISVLAFSKKVLALH